MKRSLGIALCLLLSLLLFAPHAVADIDNANAGNVHEGDNDSDRDQSGEAESGDAVAGQVVGVTSSGDASVDATNTTRDSRAETGDVEGANAILAVVGPVTGSIELDAADITNTNADNVQEGDNAGEFVQSAAVDSGDAVAGQVAGVVTSDGGVADLVLANTTENADVESGDSAFENIVQAVVGSPGAGSGFGGALVLNIAGDQVDEGGQLNFVVSLSSARSKSGKVGAGKVQAAEHHSQGGVTFTVQTADGTATAELDYSPESGTYSFGGGGGGAGRSFAMAAGSSSVTIPVSTNQDQAFCEGDEDMTMTITSATGATIGDGTATGVIRDEDVKC